MIYIINIFLGCIFVYFDLHGYNSNFIKWLISFNSFIYLFLIKVNVYAVLATAITFIADYFLLFTNHYLTGISLFIIVQLTYMHLLKYYIYFPFLFLIFIFINPLITLAFIYLCFSLLNLFHSFKISKSFFSAIILLLCCDITIALTHLQLIDSAYNPIIWLFYIPSQLCFIYSQKILPKSIL